MVCSVLSGEKKLALNPENNGMASLYYGKHWKWEETGAWADEIGVLLDDLSPLGGLAFCCVCVTRVLPDYLAHDPTDSSVIRAVDIAKAFCSGQQISVPECKSIVNKLYEECPSLIRSRRYSALLDVYVTLSEVINLNEGRFEMPLMSFVANRADVCPKEKQYQMETIKLIKSKSPSGSCPPLGTPIAPDLINIAMRQAGWHDDPWIDGTTTLKD
jgi:hypothetical protein